MKIVVGICPTCGTQLDTEELVVATHWFEAWCVTCNRYVRKRIRRQIT